MNHYTLYDESENPYNAKKKSVIPSVRPPSKERSDELLEQTRLTLGSSPAELVFNNPVGIEIPMETFTYYFLKLRAGFNSTKLCFWAY